MTADDMVWNLSQLVDSTAPTIIRRQLDSMVAEAQTLRNNYHGNIEALDAKGLLAFLTLKDAFTLKFEGVTMYSRLMYSANSTDDLAKQLNDTSRKASMQVSQALAFIDIELGRLLSENPSIISNPFLAEYKHYLERMLRKVPYILTEAQERLMIIKDQNGINAWQILQSDWLSTRSFDIEVEGEIQTLPYGAIIGLYQNPDRDLRKRANQIVYEGLGKDQLIWASALRAISSDHLQICELRKYPTPMTQSLIANDVDPLTIDSLMKTVKKNVDLYQHYLQLKAKLMQVEKLANYDIVAPLRDSPKLEYTWREARKEVADAYWNFDEELGGWIEEMFEQRHIDGEVRTGKRSGAFCASWLAGKSAYILQSFNGTMGDVYTLAHELGHAVHAYLGSRAQKPSNYEIGSCIAETGSIFGELLLTESLLSKARSKMEKRAILIYILDEFGMAAFQVSARVFFEQSMYETIARGEFLDGETVAKLWVAARDTIYGDSVGWLDEMKWEWTMKPHYYMANYRFYNYPYVFAQLFVFSLFRLYKKQGKNFVPKLKSLLATGSSKSPRELSLELGFDITTVAFWEQGIQQAREFIDMIETL